ncbi:MAG: hypothetical protein FWF54_02685 [Candidatus Azobacteroides sp.]|nr:hypothetical protein [Candidatus Azobacteroides sp.]
MLDRIKQYIDFKGINISRFEKSIDMSNASFGKSLKNKGSIGSDKLERILKAYPDLNPEWLLTGKGEMLKKLDSSTVNQSIRGNNNIQTGHNNIQTVNNSKVTGTNRHHSDSPDVDVLQAKIDEKDRLIAEKDVQLAEKDAIISNLIRQ